MHANFRLTTLAVNRPSSVGDGDGLSEMIVAGELVDQECGEVRASDRVGLVTTVGSEDAHVAGGGLIVEDRGSGNDPVQITCAAPLPPSQLCPAGPLEGRLP